MLKDIAIVSSLLIAGGAWAGDDAPFPMPPPSSITQVGPPAPALLRRPLPVETLGSLCVNARVNVNALTLTQPQVEPGVASNPLDPLRVVAGFADFQSSPPATDGAPGVALSVDGGHTWVIPAGGAVLPNPPGFIWGNRTLATHLAAGDSAIAWGLNDTVYFSMIGFHDNTNPPGGNCASGGLYVYRSDDGGDSWFLPAGGPAISNTTTIFRDKEYIAADSFPGSPFAGRLYMVWDDDVYSGCPQIFNSNFVTRRLAFSFSDDGAATWSPPIILFEGCFVAPVPAVAANGDVYVVWFDCSAGIRMRARKSTNGGASFGTTMTVASGLTAPPNPLIGSNFRVNAAFPSIATDPTDADNVYVTWSSDNGASQTDVFVSRTLDGGASWSAPLRVNDDAVGNPRDQFFPWISVGAEGTVRIMWGDDRLDLVNPGGRLYDIFMAESTNQGASFGANIRMSTVSSDPQFDGFGGTFIGDYFGLSASGVPVWDDERDLNQDIYGAPSPTILVPSQYATIQAAIDAWVCNQQIVLEDGVHSGPGNVNLNFGGKAIRMRSASGDPTRCVIDCLNTPDTRGFDFVSGEPSTTVIEGITVRNGFMHGVNPFDRGGAVNCVVDSNPTFINCIFEGNSAVFGGAVLVFDASPSFVNCVFVNNLASDIAGGMDIFGGSDVTVTGCAFSRNQGANDVGAIITFDSTLTIANSVFWGDLPNEIIEVNSTTTVDYSIVQGGWFGSGGDNLASDPLYVDAPAGDLRLGSGSPAIDAGDNLAVFADVIDLDSDGDVAEPQPDDPDRNPRFADHSGTPDTGNPDGVNPIVDIGAYEYVTPPCPWDLTGDDLVSTADLLLLLAAWGSSPGGPPDFDGNGSVGTSDLLELLAHWGVCP